MAPGPYASLTDADVMHFKQIIGAAHVIEDPQRLAEMNTDWMRKFKGSSRVALLPGSTEEVSEILRFCNERRLAVVPQGGNTSLAGASVPVLDEVILNLGRMNRVESIDPMGVAICEVQYACRALITMYSLASASASAS